MTLLQATDELVRLAEVLPGKLRSLAEEEFRYTSRLMRLLAEAPQTSQDKREAVAKSILIEEGIYETYHSLKLDVKVLLLQKEIVTEISRNLRSPHD